MKIFCDATDIDAFITFFKGKMYWCNLDNSLIEQDSISKFRKTITGWSCSNINDKNQIQYSNEISGEISKTQAFQGTLCSFNAREIGIIKRTISGTLNENVEIIMNYKRKICDITTELLRELHWKDCETLTDLIFLQSGWRRVSMKVGSMEYTDMEYYDPINNDKNAFQIKSGEKKKDFEKYKEDFIDRDFRKIFFVDFKPDNALSEIIKEKTDIEILSGKKLATLIFDLGLLEWKLR